MAEIKIANKNEIKDGQGTVVLVNEKEIALFNIQGNFYAIDNNCCHRGGPLAEGEIEDKIVTCPWHGWKFDVKTGECIMPGSAKLNSYNINIKGEEIFISIGE